MKVRISWVRCPDCGRTSEKPGYCVIVEHVIDLILFRLVRPLLITYDRTGESMAQHYKSVAAAYTALEDSKPERQPPEQLLVREFEV